jgi:dihydroorotase
VAIDLLIRNVTLVSPAGRREADIGIDDGRFVATDTVGGVEAIAAAAIDGTGLFALPGVIDEHVHFRQPGFEHKEDWLTGSRAAVMGGVTTVLDMPNTFPPTDTAEAAREKARVAEGRAYCDFGLLGRVGGSLDSLADLLGSGLVVGLKVFLGPTTGGLSAPTDDGLRRALELARAADLRVGFHAEDRSVIAAAESRLHAAGRNDPPAHLESRPLEAEVMAIDHACELLRETGARGHVFHLSSADGLAAVDRWRAAGVDLTCEVTPHHCLLGLDAYSSGRARVNPPFRGEPHASALLAALVDGRIDCLASDHAPHTAAEKQRRAIWDVPSGFAGVETLLPLLLTHGVNAGRISLERLVQVTSEGPAKAWGLWPKKGQVVVGSDADLTLVDLRRNGVVRAAELHGKNNLSPFEGWPTVGAAVATIVRGRIVMRGGQLLGEPGWGGRA